jgi:hypothetical protein
LTASSRCFATSALAIVTVLIHVLRLCSVLDSVHRVVHPAITVVVESKVGSATGTATLSLVVAGERVPTCKLSATLRALVRPLSSVQLGVAFQVVQPTESGLALLTLVGLFLTVSEKMALQVVVACENGGTVRALVALL